MNSKPSSIKLRPWRIEDAVFVCHMRNDPNLMKWYRQNEPIELEVQKHFIEWDFDYNGQIVELKNIPIGVFAVRDSGELCLVLEDKYYWCVPKLVNAIRKPMHFEMFVGNPLMKVLMNCGFEIVKVKERAYYKKDRGLVDVVYMERPYVRQQSSKPTAMQEMRQTFVPS